MKADDISGRLAMDARALNDLRATAKKDPREGLKAAAQQFEAYFMQMVMKSMRDATPQDGLFDSDQTRLYTSMLDQQMAQGLSGKGGLGFAKLIEAQLARNLPMPPESMRGSAGQVAASSAANPTLPATHSAAPAQTLPLANPAVSAAVGRPATSATPATSASSPSDSQAGLSGRNTASVAEEPAGGAQNSMPVTARQAVDSLTALADDWDVQTPRDFVTRMWPHAVEAAKSLGVPPHFLVAHAALESGWGQHEPRSADGAASFNLFGVKAGRRWAGASVESQTTEFVNGVSTPSRERFRAYASYGEAFRDYATLLRSNPRFSSVVGVTDGTEFARKLQQTGYATDPMYAEKLARIIHGTTLRQALTG